MKAKTITLWVPALGSRYERDRKSTRLNSSHLVISYAVFCLKKKTSKIPPSLFHLPHPANDLARTYPLPYSELSTLIHLLPALHAPAALGVSDSNGFLVLAL